MDFSRFRLPYRDDALFSILCFVVFILPLAFVLKTYELFETIKFALFVTGVGWAIFVYASAGKKNPNEGERALKLGYNPLFLLGLLIFWILSLWSVLYSVDLVNGFFGTRGRFTSGLMFYSLWVIFMAMFYSRLTVERYKFVAGILVFDGFLVALFGFLQSMGFAFYSGLTTDVFLRAPSLLGNPNFSSMFTAAVFPLACLGIMEARTRIGKSYYVLSALLIVLSIITLASRGSVLALMIGLLSFLVFLVLSRASKRYVYVMLGALLAAGLLTFLFFNISRPGAISSTLSLTETNINERLNGWELAISEGLVKSPWLGWGLGSYHIFFESARAEHINGKHFSAIFDDAHNIFIQLGVTGGLPLMLVFVLLICLALFYGYQALRKEGGRVAAATMAGMVALLVGMSFNPVPIPCYILLGVFMCGLVFFGGPRKEFNFRSFWQPVFKVSGLILVAAGLCFITAEHLFFVGYASYLGRDYEKAGSYLRVARVLDPSNQLTVLYSIATDIKLRRGQVGEIEQDIKKFVNMHPVSAGSYFSAGRLYNLLYQRTGQEQIFNKVLANAKKSLILDPYTGDNYGVLGHYYYIHNQRAAAKEVVKINLILKPSSTPSWLMMAKIFQDEGKRDAVLFAIGEIYKIDPTISGIKYFLQNAKNEQDIRRLPISVPSLPERLE